MDMSLSGKSTNSETLTLSIELTSFVMAAIFLVLDDVKPHDKKPVGYSRGAHIKGSLSI